MFAVGSKVASWARALNEHAPYKRGVVRPKRHSQKLLDMHKTWPSKHLSEQHRKSSQNHAYSSCFGHKTVAIQLFYKKVDTVARAGTCDSCFRRAIADVKKSGEYRLLPSQENSPGHPNAAFSRQKEKGLVFRRLRRAQVPVSTSDRMARLIAQRTAVRSFDNAGSAKKQSR